MKTTRAALTFSLLFYLPLLHASNPGDPSTIANCETFLDSNEKKPAETTNVGHVRNFINTTVLKNYKPTPLATQTSLGVVAYGGIDPDLLQNLPNFISYQFQNCPMEAVELRCRVVEKMIAQFYPNWIEEKIWFFEVTDPISLMKHGANLPTKFDRDTYVIMRDSFPIGSATVGEIDKIEWF